MKIITEITESVPKQRPLVSGLGNTVYQTVWRSQYTFPGQLAHLTTNLLTNFQSEGFVLVVVFGIKLPVWTWTKASGKWIIGCMRSNVCRPSCSSIEPDWRRTRKFKSTFLSDGFVDHALAIKTLKERQRSRKRKPDKQTSTALPIAFALWA